MVEYQSIALHHLNCTHQALHPANEYGIFPIVLLMPSLFFSQAKCRLIVSQDALPPTFGVPHGSLSFLPLQALRVSFVGPGHMGLGAGVGAGVVCRRRSRLRRCSRRRERLRRIGAFVGASVGASVGDSVGTGTVVVNVVVRRRERLRRERRRRVVGASVGTGVGGFVGASSSGSSGDFVGGSVVG